MFITLLYCSNEVPISADPALSFHSQDFSLSHFAQGCCMDQLTTSQHLGVCSSTFFLFLFYFFLLWRDSFHWSAWNTRSSHKNQDLTYINPSSIFTHGNNSSILREKKASLSKTKKPTFFFFFFSLHNLAWAVYILVYLCLRIFECVQSWALSFSFVRMLDLPCACVAICNYCTALTTLS